MAASEKVGELFNLSPLVVGLILMAFGTSLPELFVSHLACLGGNSGIALGNIIGSNIGNMFLILGLTGCLTSLSFSSASRRHLTYLHLGMSVLLVLVLFPSSYYLISSIVLLLYFCFYLFSSLKEMKRSQLIKEVDIKEKKTSGVKSTPWNIFVLASKLILGFFLLYYGGKVLVSSSTEICVLLGIPEYIVSAAIVALGTSLPELVTCLLAVARKKDVGLIAGNILGSNIFNVGFILGGLGLYEIDIHRNFMVETITLVLATIYLLALGKKKVHFGKKSGILFLGLYVSVLTYWVVGK